MEDRSRRLTAKILGGKQANHMKPASYVSAVCLLTLSLRAAPAALSEVRGAVLDGGGSPIAEATLAEQWGIEKGVGQSPLTPVATTTHADGSFSLRPTSEFNGRFALLVFDKARLQGAIIDLPTSKLHSPFAIRLQTLQNVRYTIVLPDSLREESSSAELYTSSGIPIAALPGVTRGSVSLPPGNYLLKARVPDSEVAVSTFSVGTQEVTVPPLHIEPSSIAQHYGHGTPDLTPSLLTLDQKSATIHPVRGEWTLLYFWATWCEPCISEGMPQLIAFANAPRTHLPPSASLPFTRRARERTATGRNFTTKPSFFNATGGMWRHCPLMSYTMNRPASPRRGVLRHSRHTL